MLLRHTVVSRTSKSGIAPNCKRCMETDNVGLLCVARISAVRELAENEAKFTEPGPGQERWSDLE